MDTIRIYFDGGCRPTNPGNKYGSFEVLLNNAIVKRELQRELGIGTNNEAEWEILIEALRWTIDNLAGAGLDPGRYRAELFTDSTIVANRLRGKNRTRKTDAQQRMHALCEQCTFHLRRFAAFGVVWHRREHNMSRFGH